MFFDSPEPDCRQGVTNANSIRVYVINPVIVFNIMNFFSCMQVVQSVVEVCGFGDAIEATTQSEISVEML